MAAVAVACVVQIGVASHAPTPQVTTATEAVTVTAAARALGASEREAAEVVRAYGPGPLATSWTTTHGALSDAADAAFARMRGADAHGLRPADYLTPAIDAAVMAPALSVEARLRRDVAITLAVLRYMRHLHLGRVDPRTLGFHFETREQPPDFAGKLAAAVRARRVGEALDDLAPRLAPYETLLAALPRYRALAAEPLPPVPGVAKTVHVGEAYPGVHAVGRYLAAVGDLDASAVPPPEATGYEEALAAAVRRFQRRHGLTPDGALGGRTLAALQVPLSTRADQIALALERLRWLPDLGTRPVVAVNVPMFRLWAWDAGGLGAPPAVSMAVIVGRARRTQTPLFTAPMTQVIFRPYWNVPASILRDEILPAVQKNPGYLSSQQMEIVRGPGDDARVVAQDEAALRALGAGTLRVRQRPGPHNALGLVKFDFPNRDSVFMHGTPAPSLFARDRRDFSHGCIRVADPPALAAWVLADAPGGWTPARIAAAMAADTSAPAPVGAPIDVVLFYLTAMGGPDDGSLHFADDIYGHDVRLTAALARR